LNTHLSYSFFFQWDNNRAHVRWTHKISGPTEPSLSPPVETKAASVQVSYSSPTQQPLNNLSTLQRLWIQSVFDDDDNMDSDNESA